MSDQPDLQTQIQENILEVSRKLAKQVKTPVLTSHTFYEKAAVWLVNCSYDTVHLYPNFSTGTVVAVGIKFENQYHLKHFDLLRFFPLGAWAGMDSRYEASADMTSSQRWDLLFATLAKYAQEIL